MKKAYLEAGEFVTTHGIVGELRLYPWSDDADFLTRFATLYLDAGGAKPLVVERARAHKNICIVKLEGVNSIEQARPYIGKTVYIARADAQLEEGRIFVQDLLGASVIDADTGRVYGAITAITHPGHHDVYEVQNEAGELFLFPAVAEFVQTIDVEKGCIAVRPIPGMFGDEKAGEGGG